MTSPEVVGSNTPAATSTAERIALAVGFVALSVAVIGTRWGEFTPDTRPDLYQQPAQFVRQSLEAWVGGATGMGQGNFNAGAAPVGAVVWVLRTLGCSAWLAVRVWRLLVLVLAAWGIRRYLAELFGARLTPAARFVATFFWIANPYVIVAGNSTPILLPYALLPWTMWALLRATRRGGWRWPAVFALTFFLQSGLNAGVVPFFQLAAIPAHLVYVRYADGRPWRPILAALARCGLLSVLVSLYWLAPSMLASGAGVSIAASTEKPRDVARTSSYAETARGLGMWSLYGRFGDRFYLGGYTVYLTNRFVLLTTFGTTAALGYALVRARSRVRLLAVGLVVTALPIMVGLFPGTHPNPAGRALEAVFDNVAATMAFRTTNKVGSVVMLGFVTVVVMGIHALQTSLRGRPLALRSGAFALVAVLLVGLSMPLWNGSLYPLGYTVPERWHQAMTDLERAGDGRVLVVPGGTGGNYRWGMRSPDDIFLSHLDRPVISRNTVVGAGDPGGNFLTWFDTALQLGELPDDGVSTISRYLGADRVVNRNDVLSEETEGGRPSVISDVVGADPGLVPVKSYGRPGTDTVPGTSGRATVADRGRAPADATLPPIEVFSVRDPVPAAALHDESDLVIVDGDGAAFAPLTGLGILAGSPPVRYLGDLDVDEIEASIERGARIVFTDTNQRRGWDINRLLYASTATLAEDEPFERGSGPSITLWPDHVDRQTVLALGPKVRSVTTTIENFGVRPTQRAAFIVDGNDSTTFYSGGVVSTVGGSLRIELKGRPSITSVQLKVPVTEPARITRLSVTVGSQRFDVPVVGDDQWIGLSMDPEETNHIDLTVTGTTKGLNPVGFPEVRINGGDIAAAPTLVTPRTFSSAMEAADAATRRRILSRLESTPLDVVFDRLRGSSGLVGDDEELALDRTFELPVDSVMTFRARLDESGMFEDVLKAARAGDDSCRHVAYLDGEPVMARIEDFDASGAGGAITMQGCSKLRIPAGSHHLQPMFGWQLNQVHLATSSDESNATSAPSAPQPVVREASATRLVLDVPAGASQRLLRTGIGFDPRWRASSDGKDLGPPIVLDGYSSGWQIGPEAATVEVYFPPQKIVSATFVVSAIGVVAVSAIAFLPMTSMPGRREDESEPDGDEVATDD